MTTSSSTKLNPSRGDASVLAQRSYLTVMVTAWNCSGAAPPPASVADAVHRDRRRTGGDDIDEQGGDDTGARHARTSPGRVIAMSTRPAAASIFCVKAAATPPWRSRLPSWTLRTRSTAGLKFTDSDTVDSRVAPEIDIGTGRGRHRHGIRCQAD